MRFLSTLIIHLVISGYFLLSPSHITHFSASSTRNQTRLLVFHSPPHDNYQKQSPSSSRAVSFHLPSNTVSPRIITLKFLILEIVSGPEPLNVSIASSVYFLQLSTRNIYVQEVLNIICNSNFDAKLLSFQKFSMKGYDDIASTVVRSTRSKQ